VYIEEAHPRDGWACYTHVDYDAPVTMEDRCSLAEKMFDLSKCELQLRLVDLIDNNVEKMFCAFPERLFVLDGDGTLLFKGGLGPDNYMTGFEEFLNDTLT
jgi:hypothetical protein